MLRYFGIVNKWRIEIYNDSYTGVAKEMSIVANSATLVKGRQELYDVVNFTAGSISVYSDTNFEYTAMQLEGDLDNRVVIKIGDNIVFTGYVENGVYEEEFVAPPYEVKITFVCGLKKLEGLYFNIDTIVDQAYTNMLELIQICLSPILQPNQYGQKTLYVNCKLTNEAYKIGDAWTAFEQTLLHQYSLTNEKISYLSIIKDILTSFGAMIYQRKGDWYVERIKDKMRKNKVKYVKYNIGVKYDILTNRGECIEIDTPVFKLGETSNYFLGRPKLTIEKEYGSQAITVNTAMKDSIISPDFSINKRVPMLRYGPYGNDRVALFHQNVVALDGVVYTQPDRSPYVWYIPSDMPKSTLMDITPVKSVYGIGNGLKFGHKAGNNLHNHAYTSAPFHIVSGCTLKFSMKVHVDITADQLTKKTWIIIPVYVNDVAYINTTDYPYDHKSYQAGSAFIGDMSLTLINSEYSTPKVYQLLTAHAFFCYNSADDRDKFEKWYNNEAVEVSLEVNNGNWIYLNDESISSNLIRVAVFPAQFADGNYKPTTDVINIRATTVGDISVTTNTIEEMESGYEIAVTTDDGKVQIKREAPEVSLNFWDGPPIYDYRTDINTGAIIKTLYTNFSIKKLIICPTFSKIYDLDSAGNPVAKKLIDGVVPSVTITNTRNYNWYDYSRPIDEYNKKAFLIEHVAQDRFDCYAIARRKFECQFDDVRMPDLNDTYDIKYQEGNYIATNIEYDLEENVWSVTLEEIRDRVVETKLFIPRNEVNKQ